MSRRASLRIFALNAVTPFRTAPLILIPEHELTEAVARTPLDQYVIWDGRPRTGRPNSILTHAQPCIEEVWSPVPLRILLRRAARLSGGLGLPPEGVRKAIWAHQSAKPTSYFLVRATAQGDYVAVTDVPRPSFRSAPLKAGDFILESSRRLDPASARSELQKRA